MKGGENRYGLPPGTAYLVSSALQRCVHDVLPGELCVVNLCACLCVVFFSNKIMLLLVKELMVDLELNVVVSIDRGLLLFAH